MLANALKLSFLSSVLGALLVVTACGDDDGDDGAPGGAGSAGAAGSVAGRGGAGGTPATNGGGGRGGSPAIGGTGGTQEVPEPIECGTKLCEPLVLPIPMVPPVAPCCADEAESICGLDTALLDGFGAESTRACEPLGQPGVRDTECPDSAQFDAGNGMVLPPFSGCCREETGTCGYLVNTVFGVLPIGLGCVDSSPFLQGGSPLPCGSGAGGGSSD